MTTCGSCPHSRIRSRPTRRLKSWSVPPSSTSALERDRVVPLAERVEELVDGDRLLRREALGEVVALEKAGHRVLRREPDHSLGAEGREPAGVEVDDGRLRVEDLEDLRLVGLGVREDLVLARELRARRLLPRRVADHAGEVADQEDDLVPQLLEVAHLPEDDGVAEVEVGRGRVEADLHAERLAASSPRGASFFSSSSRWTQASVPFRRRSSCSGTGGKVATRRIVGDGPGATPAPRASYTPLVDTEELNRLIRSLNAPAGDESLELVRGDETRNGGLGRASHGGRGALRRSRRSSRRDRPARRHRPPPRPRGVPRRPDPRPPRAAPRRSRSDRRPSATSSGPLSPPSGGAASPTPARPTCRSGSRRSAASG